MADIEAEKFRDEVNGVIMRLTAVFDGRDTGVCQAAVARVIAYLAVAGNGCGTILEIAETAHATLREIVVE